MENKVGIITMEKADNRVKNSVGSSRIRARWLLPYWLEAEEYQIGELYDILIYQKVYWEEMMDNFKGIQIMDLCDPDWLEGKDVFKYIDMADATVTSTQALADYIKKLRPNKKIICIPDRVDIGKHQSKRHHSGVAKKAVWFGYSGNAHYLERTFDSLIERGLELTIISDKPYEASLAFQTLKLKNTTYEYPKVHQDIIENDIVLMPEPTDERGKYKSNNKTLTAWALGMPVATTPEDLDKYEEELERNKEVAIRMEEIKKKWDVKISVEEYRQLIGDIITIKDQ